MHADIGVSALSTRLQPGSLTLQSSDGVQGPRMLSYNPAENAVLITSDVDGGSYELYVVPKDASGRSDTPVRYGSSAGATFLTCCCLG